MSVRDKKQATFLVVLLAILGLTLYLGPRINRAPTASAVQTPEATPETPAPVVTDARIRIDLIDSKASKLEAGDENLFQYRTAPQAAPVIPAPGAPQVGAPGAAPPPVFTPPPPTGPPVPPPPPPINLRYQGFARSEAGGGELTAFLSDDRGRYNVKTGEVLMGRYRIAGITDASVEVEDLQLNRRQTLPLLK
jgi:hypothetical protein